MKKTMALLDDIIENLEVIKHHIEERGIATSGERTLKEFMSCYSYLPNEVSVLLDALSNTHGDTKLKDIDYD